MADKRSRNVFRRAVRNLCAVKGKFGSSKRPITSYRKAEAVRRAMVGGLRGLRVLETEVVRFRTGSARTWVYARVPAAVKELLRLRAQCDGMATPPGRIARFAVEAMEKHSYDPINAVDALSKSLLLSPVRLSRVLGSGCNGTVFLEETGDVVKVMLDDDAPDEYRHLATFHAAGLAPQPVALVGPRLKFGGSLYNLRMEAVDFTLRDMLRAERGAGGSTSSAAIGAGANAMGVSSEAQGLGVALSKMLARMLSAGLVHGDLHLGNVGVKIMGGSWSLMLLDFGRSANVAERGGVAVCGPALRSGHDYDVFNLIVELCSSFEDLLPNLAEDGAMLERRLRGLVRSSRTVQAVCMPEEHRLRQIAALQRRVDDQRGAAARAEALHDAVLAGVVRYASLSCGWSPEGPVSVRNGELRKAAVKRMRAGYAAYFASDLYWGDWQYKE